MLTLTRKPRQSIIISVPPSALTQHITVQVVNVRGMKVQLGTQAEREVTVHRKEVFEEIAREGARA